MNQGNDTLIMLHNILGNLYSQTVIDSHEHGWHVHPVIMVSRWNTQSIASQMLSVSAACTIKVETVIELFLTVRSISINWRHHSRDSNRWQVNSQFVIPVIIYLCDDRYLFVSVSLSVCVCGMCAYDVINKI